MEVPIAQGGNVDHSQCAKAHFALQKGSVLDACSAEQEAERHATRNPKQARFMIRKSQQPVRGRERQLSEFAQQQINPKQG